LAATSALAGRLKAESAERRAGLAVKVAEPCIRRRFKRTAAEVAAVPRAATSAASSAAVWPMRRLRRFGRPPHHRIDGEGSQGGAARRRRGAFCCAPAGGESEPLAVKVAEPCRLKIGHFLLQNLLKLNKRSGNIRENKELRIEN